MVERSLLSNRKTACWVYLNTPNAAEVIAQSGFDVVIVDQEHSPWSPSDTLASIRAIQVGGAVPAVRIPEVNAGHVKAALDNGADILIAPDVNTASDAKMLAQNCRYAPLGHRGVAHLSARAAGWGRSATQYLDEANDRIVVVAMLESLQAINNADDIASTPGIDAIMVGTVDLTVDLRARSDAPTVSECIRLAELAAKKHGLQMVGVDRPADPAEALFNRGYWMVTIGNDAKFLRGAADAAVAPFQD